MTKTMPGYGELFRMLSYDDIGPAAMLSRAIGGVLNKVVVLTMPGSVAAVQLAMEKLIVPEIGHLVYRGAEVRSVSQFRVADSLNSSCTFGITVERA